MLSSSEFRVSPSPAVKLFDDCWAFDFAEFFRTEDLKVKQPELMKLKDDHKAPRNEFVRKEDLKQKRFEVLQLEVDPKAPKWVESAEARSHESSNYDPKEIRKQLLMRM